MIHFCQFRNQLKFIVDIVIALGAVGNQALGAVFDSLLGIAAVTAAMVAYKVLLRLVLATSGRIRMDCVSGL